MTRPSRIVLTGFSGTGKSLVAPIVAQRQHPRRPGFSLADGGPHQPTIG